MSLSKKLYEKYMLNKTVIKTSKRMAYEFLSEAQKNSIFNTITAIKDLEQIGYSANVPANIKTMREVNTVKTLKVNVKGTEKTFKINQTRMLMNVKQNKKTQGPATKAEKIEVKKAVFKYVKNDMEGKFKIQDVITHDEDINVTVTYEALIKFETGNAGEAVIRGPYQLVYICNDKNENNEEAIKELMRIEVLNTFENMAFELVKITIIKITDNVTRNKTYDLIDMKLRDENPIDLINIFGEQIDINKSDDNCVLNAFKKLPVGQKSDLKKYLKNKDYITPTEIYEFCVKNHIRVFIYDIQGRILYKNKIRSKQHAKSFYLVSFNEHCYILKNPYLQSKTKYDFYKIDRIVMTQNELDDKFVKIMESGILPTDIQFNKNLLFSYIHKNKYYFVNPDFEMCEKILKTYGLEEKIKPYTHRKNLIEILIPLYNGKQYIDKSFFPYTDLKKEPFVYINNNYDHDENLKCADGVKFYSKCLRDLPYLIYCDVRYMPMNKNVDINNITDHYLYHINPINTTIQCHTKGVYTGETVNLLLKNKVQIEILEEQTTVKRPNFYKKLIDDIYNLDVPEQFQKDMCNMHIGMMAKKMKFNKKYIYNALCPTKEKLYNNSKEIIISGQTYNFTYDDIVDGDLNVFNNYPINIQVKDKSHIRLYEEITKLDLSPKDVVAILTDGIIYYDREHVKFTPDEYWIEKPIKYSELNKQDPDYTGSNDNFSFAKIHNQENIKNVLVDGYAGMGKSHYIKNTLIPKIDDYIVLSPSHSTIETYRESFTCDVIQKYTNTKTLPTQQNIIIDEYGMMDSKGWIMLFKCLLYGKRFFLFGDKNQLTPPFEEHKELTDTFLNSIFSQRIHCKANWRNNYHVDFYELLMNESMSKENIEIIINKPELNSNHKDCVYVGIRKKTCEKKNLEILEKLGKYEDGEFKDMKGVPIICKCNDYVKYELYNNFECTIKEYNKETVTVTFNEVDIKIKNKIFHKRFEFAYAVNLHAFQGKESEHIHFLKDDKDLLWNPRTLYTLISRHKEKLSKKQIEYNKTCQYEIII